MEPAGASHVRPITQSATQPLSAARPYPNHEHGRSILVISLTVYLYFELFSAAALALWVIARFPQLGPKSIVSAAGVVLVALVGGRLAAPHAGALVGLPFGIYVTLLGCVLPLFFSICLTTGWLLRAFLAATHGSGGGTGHRVDA
jgi:hypothetical protein